MIRDYASPLTTSSCAAFSNRTPVTRTLCTRRLSCSSSYTLVDTAARRERCKTSLNLDSKTQHLRVRYKILTFHDWLIERSGSGSIADHLGLYCEHKSDVLSCVGLVMVMLGRTTTSMRDVAARAAFLQKLYNDTPLSFPTDCLDKYPCFHIIHSKMPRYVRLVISVHH